MDGYLAQLRIICSAFGESETRPINLLIREFVSMSRDSYSCRSTGPVVLKASSNPQTVRLLLVEAHSALITTWTYAKQETIPIFLRACIFL